MVGPLAGRHSPTRIGNYLVPEHGRYHGRIADTFDASLKMQQSFIYTALIAELETDYCYQVLWEDDTRMA